MLLIAPFREYQNAVRFFTLVNWGLLKKNLPVFPCQETSAVWKARVLMDILIMGHFTLWSLIAVHYLQKDFVFKHIYKKILQLIWKHSKKYNKIQYGHWMVVVCVNYISMNSYQGFFLFQWLFLCVDLFPKVYFCKDTNFEVLLTKKLLGILSVIAQK